MADLGEVRLLPEKPPLMVITGYQTETRAVNYGVVRLVPEIKPPLMEVTDYRIAGTFTTNISPTTGQIWPRGQGT